jgi:hypothetical protein
MVISRVCSVTYFQPCIRLASVSLHDFPLLIGAVACPTNFCLAGFLFVIPITVCFFNLVLQVFYTKLF